MLPVQCEDCKFASWDYTLFRDNQSRYDIVTKMTRPPYNEQFDLYCAKHERFYLEEEITGDCPDGVPGDNNYSECCREYYRERDEYLEQLKKENNNSLISNT